MPNDTATQIGRSADRINFIEEHRLTDREVSVVALLVAGRSTSEIATLLKLEEQTVKNAIGKIGRKLGAHGRGMRAAVVAAAVRGGF